MAKLKVKKSKQDKLKSVNDYVYKEKVTKCKSFDEKTSLEMKNVISKISLECVSNSSDQNKNLKELYSILENKVHGKNIILRKSVLVSLCLIYKDILPTYKIVVLSDQQKQQNMKNDTIKTYSEEEILLGNYQKYIRVMESVIKKKYDIENLNHIKWTDADELTLLKCTCSLYLNNPSFNCSTMLLKLIIPNLNSTNVKLLKCATKTIETAIKEDMKLEISLNICDVIKQYATDNKFNFRSTLIKPLIFMELEDVSINEEEQKNHKSRSLMSRKQKKDLKKNKKYNQEIKQTNAKESLDTKFNKNSQIIRCIFYIYFRVLKKNTIPAKQLEIVLDGVGKYGRLVDCKLFPDIFSLMMKIAQNSKVSMENRLRSIFVSLNIVTSGKAADILLIDPANFCNKLIELGGNPNMSEASAILVINCCTKLLVKRRNHMSQSDGQNMIKMLIKLAWNYKNIPHVCSVVLVSLVRYLRIYPQYQYLFDDEDERPSDFYPDSVVEKEVNENLNYLQCLCKMSIYEISGIAKRIKKFFLQTDVDNSMFELKGSLEELTRMKTEECLEYLKEKFSKPVKRKHDNSEEINADISYKTRKYE